MRLICYLNKSGARKAMNFFKNLRLNNLTLLRIEGLGEAIFGVVQCSTRT